MTNQELEIALKQHLASAYPNIEVHVRECANTPSQREIEFVEEKFRVLYPRQRYHYLMHAIPADFYQEHLANAIWIELAPGEKPGDLDDDDIISSIANDVMKCLIGSRFFEKLDDQMSPAPIWKKGSLCQGDFRIAKKVLPQCGFREDEYSDVLHVLMAQGAYCDCEILYNVAPQSRLKAKHWHQRADENDIRSHN